MIHRVWPYRGAFFVILAFITAVVATVAVAALLVRIAERKQEAVEPYFKVAEIPHGELDAAVWGRNFPHHYDAFLKTATDYGSTPYGGSRPLSKLERWPVMRQLYAGYAFSIEYNEERGHYFSQLDQQNSRRVTETEQPGACVNCHAAEAPQLIAELGWETFNRTPYAELKERLHHGVSCADCHDPQTMGLTITRPALIQALEQRGIDLRSATRQEMRTYVCAQCHVEYYFAGEDKLLTFPWSEGLAIEEIEHYYDTRQLADWTHEATGAQMIKIQHPDYELWSTGIHARSGVACADCHMPYMRVGAAKISDHWIRSPLANLRRACGPCHNLPEEELHARVIAVQDKTAELLRTSEAALLAAIEAIGRARREGAADQELAEALRLHRAAQMRWDFVSSENSTGFHSPQEAARILAHAIDLARQAELRATQAASKPAAD